MARSLTVNHDEKPSTNPLLTVFLLLAAGILVLSAVFTAEETRAEGAASNPTVQAP
jgi:hypothetical protein